MGAVILKGMDAAFRALCQCLLSKVSRWSFVRVVLRFPSPLVRVLSSFREGCSGNSP